MAGFGPRKAEWTDIAVPENVQGPYGMRACLSPDGKVIAVAGNGPGSPTYFDPLAYARELIPPRIPYGRMFQKRIFAAPSTAQLSEYRLVYASNRVCSILAMALSASEPRRLAFIARETEKELPTHLDELGPEGIQQLIKEMEGQGLTDTLYVLNVDDGSPPKAITTFHEKLSLSDVYKDQCVMSLCWTADPNTLLCYEGESIFRVSLDGAKQEVYRRGRHNHVLGFLTPRPGGLTSFVDCYFVLDPENKRAKETRIPELISIDANGAIQQRQELDAFPPFGEEWYNFVIVGKEHWAYYHPVPDETNHFVLYVAPISDPMRKRVYRVHCDADAPCYLKLYAFTPDEKGVLLAQKVSLRQFDYGFFQEPDVPYSQLRELRL